MLVIGIVGIDSKVGTTTIALDMATKIRAYTNLKVGYINLDGKSNYVNKKDDYSLQKIVDHIQSKVKLSIKNEYLKDRDIYFLAGFENELDKPYIKPEDIEFVLESIKDVFDIIVLDIHSRVDGISVGAIMQSDQLLLVGINNNRTLSEFKQKEYIYTKLKSSYSIVVNKSESTYENKYQKPIQGYLSFSPNGYIADEKNRTLGTFDKKFNKELSVLTIDILNKHGYKIEEKKKWYEWRKNGQTNL